MVGPRLVAPVLSHRPGGPALAGHQKRRHAGQSARPVLHHVHQHRGQRLGDPFGQHPPNDPGPDHAHGEAVGVANLLDQKGLHEQSAVRQHAEGHRHLEGRGGELVAERERVRRLAGPLLGPAQDARRLARQGDPGRSPKSKVAQVGVLLPAGHARRELGNPHVGRLLDHLVKGHPAAGVDVGDLAPRDLPAPVFGVHRIRQGGQAVVQESRRREGLDSGAGLVGVGDGGEGSRRPVRDRGHGQDLAGDRVRHDQVAAPRGGRVDRGGEDLLGDGLQVHVDRENHIPPRNRLLDDQHAARNLTALVVPGDDLAARPPRQRRVHRLLHAAGSPPVLHQPQQPPAQLGARVEAVQLPLHVHSPQPPHLGDLGHRVAPRYDVPRPSFLRDPPRRAGTHSQVLHQSRGRHLSVLELVGSDPDLGPPVADRQLAPVAVQDPAPGRGNGLALLVLSQGVPYPRAALRHLHFGRPERQNAAQDDPRQENGAPARTHLPVLGTPPPGPAHQSPPDGITTSPSRGGRSPRRRAASAATQLRPSTRAS